MELVDRLARVLETATWGEKVRYVLPLMGLNIFAWQVPLVDRSGFGDSGHSGSGTWTYGISTGLENDGVNSLLTFPMNMVALGATNNGGMGWVSLGVTSYPNWCLGQIDNFGTNTFAIYLPDVNNQYFYWGGAGTRAVGAGNTSGFSNMYGQRTSANDRQFWFNGVFQTPNVGTDPAVINAMQQAYGFAAHPYNQAPLISRQRCGLVYFTDGSMFSSEIIDMHRRFTNEYLVPSGRALSSAS